MLHRFLSVRLHHRYEYKKKGSNLVDITAFDMLSILALTI